MRERPCPKGWGWRRHSHKHDKGDSRASTRGRSRVEDATAEEAPPPSAQEELFGLRFQAATGQLESSSRMRNVRKDIARIYTVLQERNLGIVDEPVVEEK